MNGATPADLPDILRAESARVGIAPDGHIILDFDCGSGRRVALMLAPQHAREVALGLISTAALVDHGYRPTRTESGLVLPDA